MLAKSSRVRLWWNSVKKGNQSATFDEEHVMDGYKNTHLKWPINAPP